MATPFTVNPDAEFVARAQQLRESFESADGYCAKAWYIGHREWAQLHRGSSMMFGDSWGAEKRNRTEYDGLPVYLVNADTHFAIA